jgi:hypothetical protein
MYVFTIPIFIHIRVSESWLSDYQCQLFREKPYIPSWYPASHHCSQHHQQQSEYMSSNTWLWQTSWLMYRWLNDAVSITVICFLVYFTHCIIQYKSDLIFTFSTFQGCNRAIWLWVNEPSDPPNHFYCFSLQVCVHWRRNRSHIPKFW